jgi:hypothetical protein
MQVEQHPRESKLTLILPHAICIGKSGVPL